MSEKGKVVKADEADSSDEDDNEEDNADADDKKGLSGNKLFQKKL